LRKLSGWVGRNCYNRTKSERMGAESSRTHSYWCAFLPVSRLSRHPGRCLNSRSRCFDKVNSLFRNIFHITPLKPKILVVLARNSMIPIGRGKGGTPHNLLLIVYVVTTRKSGGRRQPTVRILTGREFGTRHSFLIRRRHGPRRTQPQDGTRHRHINPGRRSRRP